jgi:hypothetical protein
LSVDEDFLTQLLAALAKVNLEAIIVGASGAALLGVPVMTQDIDLLIRDTPLNRKKLEKLGVALGTARPAPVSEFSSTLTLIGAARPVDVLFDRLAGGLTFPSLRSRAVKLKLGNQTATVASLEDIIKSKSAAGRPKDLAHLPMLRDTLRTLQALGKKKPE